jgi:plasmid stabilization system protein ParE
MTYRVELTSRAEFDLREIAATVLAEAPVRGALWLDRLERSILALSQMPERCPLEPALSSKHREVRKLLFGTTRYRYRVYYTIAGDIVWVLHIRHSSRQKPDNS